MMTDFVEDEEESEPETEQDIWSRNNDAVVSHYLNGFRSDTRAEPSKDYSKSVIRLDRRHNVRKLQNHFRGIYSLRRDSIWWTLQFAEMVPGC